MIKRILCWTALFYATGIFLAQHIHIEYLIFILLIFILAIIIKAIISPRIYILFLGVAMFYIFAGIIRFSVYDDINLNLISQFIDKPCEFICTVIEQPDIKENRTVYTVRINKISVSDAEYFLNSKVLLNIYNTKSSVIFSYGDILEVKGILHKPAGALNEGGFDYSRYLKTKDIYVSAYASPNRVKRLEGGGSIGFIQDLVFNVRQFVLTNNEKYLPKEEAALLNGIILGERSSFSEKMNTDFSRSGISHITAVSGMHVAVFLAGISFLLGLVKISKTIKKIISIFAVIIFILITGAFPSVIRAGIMAIIFLLSYAINRDIDALTSLFIAGFIILIYNPVILFHAGFQLSFCATWSLIIFYPLIHKKLKWLPSYFRAIVAASLSAQLGTLPIAALHFNGISLVSIFSNIIVIPLLFPTLILGVILCIMGAISTFTGLITAGLVYIPLKIILLSSRFFSSFSFAVLRVPSPDFFIFAIYLLFLFLLYNLLRKKRKIRTVKISSVLLSILIVSVICFRLWQNSFLEISFINVGQGDAALIRVPGSISILLDAGGSEIGSSFDVGNNIVMPFLINRGIMNIDIAMVSHYHYDHAGGFLSIMESIPVNNLFLPARNEIRYNSEEFDLKGKLMEKADRHGVNVHYLTKGNTIKLNQKAYMEVLSPDEHIITTSIYNENDKSLLIRFNYGELSFLFTGDIEHQAEEYIISNSISSDADVLKVPHHGSSTSGTEDFLEAVSPDYAVISVGKNNYGHPSDSLIERLNNMGIKVFRTDYNGNITFITCRQRIRKVKVFKEGVGN